MNAKERVALRRHLHRIQSGRCAYCSKQPGYELFIEHLVPISRGGDDDPVNIVGACGDCNSRKADLTALEYLLWQVDQQKTRFWVPRPLSPNAPLRDLKRKLGWVEKRAVKIARKRAEILAQIAELERAHQVRSAA